MSDQDYKSLVKEKEDEIKKLKEELNKASKPSKMVSVFKNTLKRNIKEKTKNFFDREYKIKNMSRQVGELKKENEQNQQALKEKDALIHSIEKFNDDKRDEVQKELDEMKEAGINELMSNMPQTEEEAINRYFGYNIDLNKLRQIKETDDTEIQKSNQSAMEEDMTSENTSSTDKTEDATTTTPLDTGGNNETVREPQSAEELLVDEDKKNKEKSNDKKDFEPEINMPASTSNNDENDNAATPTINETKNKNDDSNEVSKKQEPRMLKPGGLINLGLTHVPEESKSTSETVDENSRSSKAAKNIKMPMSKSQVDTAKNKQKKQVAVPKKQLKTNQKSGRDNKRCLNLGEPIRQEVEDLTSNRKIETHAIENADSEDVNISFSDLMNVGNVIEEAELEPPTISTESVWSMEEDDDWDDSAVAI